MVYNSFYEKERDVPEVYICKAINTYCLAHFHNSLELLYIQEGTFNLVLDSVAYQPEKDDIVFIPSLSTHVISDAKSVSITLAVPANYLSLYNSYSNSREFPPILQDKTFNRNVLKPIFETMLAEQGSTNPLLLQGRIYSLLGEISKAYSMQQSAPRKDRLIAVEIIDYINDNFKYPLTLESLAQHFHYSKFHFSKLFDKLFRCTFKFYLNTIRVNYIASKLGENDRSLIDLVFDAGFNSMSTFYRHFQTVFGTNPKNYLDDGQYKRDLAAPSPRNG